MGGAKRKGGRPHASEDGTRATVPHECKRRRAHGEIDLSAYLLSLSGQFYKPTEGMYMMYSVDHREQHGDSASLLKHMVDNHVIPVTSTAAIYADKKMF